MSKILLIALLICSLAGCGGGGGGGSSASSPAAASGSSNSTSSSSSSSSTSATSSSGSSSNSMTGQQDTSSEDAWASTARSRWQWADLEGKTDYCRTPSIRWGAISGFDANQDNKNDVLLAISCYQGETDNSTQHNIQVLPAWRMFCSEPDSKSHYDCTQEKFGVTEINAAGVDSGGGSPYLHVMETPRDVNGDGLPDFWYVLNRDDGRPGFDHDNNQADADLLRDLCGDKPSRGASWDCTRRSDQSMLMSNSDGSYEIKKMPWTEVNAQGVVMLRTDDFSFDLFSFNYEGRVLAARYSGGVFEDVSKEYEGYVNSDLIDGQPYVASFFHESVNYVVTPNVSTEVAGYSPDYGDSYHTGLRSGEHLGFTLWRFDPGVGFAVSDFYIPEDEAIFSLQLEEGGETRQALGAKILDIPVVWPNWHFSNFTKLLPDEDPILVIRQEPDGGITMGSSFKAPVREDVIYSNNPNSSESGKGISETLFNMAGPVEAFYIREGQLERRTRSVLEGDVGWNIPGMKFQDLNGDSFTDLVTITGGEQRGSVYINDGEGTLNKVNMMEHWPEIEFLDVSAEEFSHGALATQLDEDDKLDLMIWVEGGTRKWWGEENTWTPGDVYILEGNYSLEDFGTLSSGKMHELVESCFSTPSSFFKKSRCVW